LVVCLALFALAASARQNESEPTRLSLKQAVELALKMNPEAAAARFRAKLAQANVSLAKSAQRPQAAFQFSEAYAQTNLATFGLNIPGIPKNTGGFNILYARPTISQSVFDIGLRRSVQAAGGHATEEHWNETATGEGIALEVVDCYLQILEIESEIDSTRARVETSEALLRQAHSFEESGHASKLDETRARERAETESAELNDLSGQRAVRRAALAELLGLSKVPELSLTDRLVPPAEEPLKASGEASGPPELQALEARLQAFKAEESRARAGRYPTVGLEASAGYLGTSVPAAIPTYNLSVSVNVPIYQGGRTEADIGAAAARIRETQEELRAVRLHVRTEAETAEIEMATARESYLMAAKAMESAKSVLELAQARFEGALATNIEVVSAQQALADEEALTSRYLYRFYIARAKLAKSRGNILSMFE
jgi:outer membrane protein TolC